jgi:tetratricopeptide (TPR) repeat protein
MKGGPCELARCATAALLLIMAFMPACICAQTTEPETLVTTATLRPRPDFFEVVLDDHKTSLPTTSVIAGDSSATLGTVTVEIGSSATLPLGSGAVAITTSTELITAGQESSSLPLEVDRSTTEAMVRQLRDLEKKNLYAEAFLLACQLVRENPDAEFAYDAAIRTAIVLSHANPEQLEPQIEFFFREAMRIAPMPGRYVVMLAHYYERMGRTEKLRKLLADFEKRNTKDPDYWVTLARLFAMTGEAPRARAFLEQALQKAPDAFPLVLLSARMYRQLGAAQKARDVMLAAVDQNYGPWQMRSLLLEFLKLPTFEPADVAQMVRAALANEVRYNVARGLADALIDSALEHRAFFRFETFLDDRVTSKKAADVEMWLAALMAQRAGDAEKSYSILMSDTAKATPVIAFERARAMGAHSRHKEAADILAVLVAEQPTEIPFRLGLAREQLATSRSIEALDTLAVVRFEDLVGDDRDEFIDIAMTAAVASGDPQRIIDLWLDLVTATTFAELQTMGDIVVRALEHDPNAQRIEDAVAEAARKPGEWPLLALYARLCARHNDHRREIESYAAYLDHAADDTQMLRFAGQLALQYALQPLHLEATTDHQTTTAVRVIDNVLADHAAAFYRRLIALQPMVADNYAALMRVYQTRGEIEAAKKVAAELVERDPESAELLATAASILDENGFLTEALHYYERALRADPSDFAVWLKYADALLASGAHRQAESIYRKILEEGYSGKPYNQPALLANLYKLATVTKETTRLVDYLTALRARPIPARPEFLLSSAKLELQLGAADRALETVELFQREFTTSTLVEESYLLAGQIWYTRGNVDKAIAAFRAAEEKFPRSRAAITAAFNIAVAEASAGRIDDAIATYRRIAAQYAHDDHALGALYEAAVLAYRGRRDRALTQKLLEEFLRTDCQDFPLRKNARAALEALAAGRDPFPASPSEESASKS